MFVCILMVDARIKTKDSVCLYTSQYSELFSVEKRFALYMGKYGKYFHILHSCFFSGV